MGWTYDELSGTGINPQELMCVCGHKGEEHHGVWWPLGMTLDECEAYGFNETGGMKPTWRAHLFFTNLLGPGYPVYEPPTVGEDGVSHYKAPVWPKRCLRHFVRLFIRGPLFVDHCHGFREAE